MLGPTVGLWGPMVVLGGARFLMSEVPLYCTGTSGLEHLYSDFGLCLCSSIKERGSKSERPLLKSRTHAIAIGVLHYEILILYRQNLIYLF